MGQAIVTTACGFEAALKGFLASEAYAYANEYRIHQEASEMFIHGCCQPARPENIREALQEIAEMENITLLVSGALKSNDARLAGDVLIGAIKQYWYRQAEEFARAAKR